MVPLELSNSLSKNLTLLILMLGVRNYDQGTHILKFWAKFLQTTQPGDMLSIMLNFLEISA